MFSGSTLSFFKKSYNAFAKVKPKVGDLDLQVPEHTFDPLKETLTKLTGKKVGPMSFRGFQQSGEQYNAIVETGKKWQEVSPFIQIDFESVQFDKGQPTEFGMFGHSSDWSDLKKGIKGVFSKYLLKALGSNIEKKDITVVGKRGIPTKANTPGMKAMFSFSAKYGIRNSLYPFLDKKGKIKIIDKKPAFEFLQPKDPRVKSIQSLEKIFELLFGASPQGGQRQDLNSFVKMLKLMKKYKSAEDIRSIFYKFVSNLWGSQAQGLERSDPKTDKDMKLAAYDEFLNVFPALKKEQARVSEWIEKYYKNYK